MKDKSQMFGIVLISVVLLSVLAFGIYAYVQDSKPIVANKYDLECTVKVGAEIDLTSFYDLTIDQVTCAKYASSCNAAYGIFGDWLYEDGNLKMTAGTKSITTDVSVLRSSGGSATKVMRINCIDNPATVLIQAYGESGELDANKVITLSGDITEETFGGSITGLWTRTMEGLKSTFGGLGGGSLTIYLILISVIIVLSGIIVGAIVIFAKL